METTPQTIRFTKMQGVGNDFVLVDGRVFKGLDGPALARDVCRRAFGIGADGLLIIDTSREADVKMRMYNPDGSPDVCGNGLRCVARYVVERSDRSLHEREGSVSLQIETLAGIRQTIVQPPQENGERHVLVDMGQPYFAPEEIPMLVPGVRVLDYPLDLGGETLKITALSTGSTHAVTFVDALPDDKTFQRIGPRVENHPLFPERTSLMWTQVERPDRLKIRIWERATGETWGCGTGACAAAVAARLHGYAAEEVTVASKGGELVIRWSEGAPILMTGPAVYVFEGVYPLHLGGPME